MAAQKKTVKRMKYSSGVTGELWKKHVLSNAGNAGIEFLDSSLLAELQRSSPLSKLVPVKLSMRPPPSSQIVTSNDNNDDEEDKENSSEVPDADEDSSNETNEIVLEEIQTMEQDGNQDDEEDIDQLEVLEREVADGHDPARCCVDCRASRERFKNMMIRKMNEILEIVGGNAGQVVERRRQPAQLLPPMPFNTVDSLTRFDTDVQQNEQMRSEFIQKMREIGGKTMLKSVKYCMEQVMTDELTKNVVWILGGENIPKISKFKFPYLIIEIIRDRFDGCTIKDVEHKIADWLRRGDDRIKCATAMVNRRQ